MWKSRTSSLTEILVYLQLNALLGTSVTRQTHEGANLWLSKVFEPRAKQYLNPYCLSCFNTHHLQHELKIIAHHGRVSWPSTERLQGWEP
jgi:hypothetical protein